jgi:hypothetical protein
MKRRLLLAALIFLSAACSSAAPTAPESLPVRAPLDTTPWQLVADSLPVFVP